MQPMNFNPWGEDGAGGLATLNKLNRQTEQDARQLQLDDLNRRKTEQDMAQQQMTMDEVSRKQQIRDKLVAEAQAIQGEQGLSLLDKQRRLSESHQKIDPYKEFAKDGVDVMESLGAEQKAKVNAYAMGTLAVLVLKSQKQTPEQIMQNPTIVKMSQDYGIPVNELMTFADKAKEVGPSAFAVDTGSGLTVVTDLSAGAPKVSVIKGKQGMTAEEYELAKERLRLKAEEEAGKNARNAANIGVRRELNDPTFKGTQEIAKEASKELPKLQTAARNAKINLDKLDRLEAAIPQLGDGLVTRMKNLGSQLTGIDFGTAEGKQIADGILGQARTTLGLVGATSDRDLQTMQKWAAGGYTKEGLTELIRELRDAEREKIALYEERSAAMPSNRKFIERPTEDVVTQIERIRATLQPGQSAKATINGQEHTIYKPIGNEAKGKTKAATPAPVSTDLYNAAKAKGFKGSPEEFRKAYDAALKRKGGR